MSTRKQVCGFFHPDEQTSSSNVQLHNFCTWIALDKDKADWQELSAKVTSAQEHFSRILHHLTSTSTLLFLMKTVKGTRHVEHGVCHNAGLRHQGNCDCMAKMGKNAPRKIKVLRAKAEMRRLIEKIVTQTSGNWASNSILMPLCC